MDVDKPGNRATTSCHLVERLAKILPEGETQSRLPGVFPSQGVHTIRTITHAIGEHPSSLGLVRTKISRAIKLSSVMPALRHS